MGENVYCTAIFDDDNLLKMTEEKLTDLTQQGLMIVSQLSLLFKDRILSIHKLDRHSSTIIGNTPDCHISIDTLAVNPKHAKVTFSEHSYFIEQLDDDSKILINGKKIDSREHLSDGDYITLGKHTLVFSFDERNEKDDFIEPRYTPTAQKGMGWIQYLNGQDMGKTIQIKKNMQTISDNKEQNVAMISHRSDGYYLSYLKGKKSPLVNNTRIGEKTSLLPDNSKICLGSQEFLFYLIN